MQQPLRESILFLCMPRDTIDIKDCARLHQPVLGLQSPPSQPFTSNLACSCLDTFRKAKSIDYLTQACRLHHRLPVSSLFVNCVNLKKSHFPDLNPELTLLRLGNGEMAMHVFATSQEQLKENYASLHSVSTFGICIIKHVSISLSQFL